MLKNEETEIISLPGPSVWWSSLENYSPLRHGFWVPKTGARYRKAWDLVWRNEWYKDEDVLELVNDFENSEILNVVKGEDKVRRHDPYDFFLF